METKESIAKYYEEKRLKVLEAVKPLLEGFAGIKNYDYIVELNEKHGHCMREYLIIDGQKIGCSSNSVSACVSEAFAYLIVTYYARERCLGAFEKQTLHHLKSYWMS